jgi:hypothetical protein
MTTRKNSRIVIKDLPANKKITLKEMKSIHGGVMDTAEMDSLIIDSLMPDDSLVIARKRPGRVKY